MANEMKINFPNDNSGAGEQNVNVTGRPLGGDFPPFMCG